MTEDNSSLIATAVNSNLIVTEDNRKATPKAKRSVMIFIIASLLIIGGLYYIYIQQDEVVLNTKTIYYMYTDECPNCKVVKEALEEMNFDEHIKLLEMNYTKISLDIPLNIKYLKAATKECSMPLSTAGVPFIYFEGECTLGRDEVIQFFKEVNDLSQIPIPN